MRRRTCAPIAEWRYLALRFIAASIARAIAMTPLLQCEGLTGEKAADLGIATMTAEEFAALLAHSIGLSVERTGDRLRLPKPLGRLAQPSHRRRTASTDNERLHLNPSHARLVHRLLRHCTARAQ